MAIQDFFGEGEQIDRDAAGNPLIRRVIPGMNIEGTVRDRTTGVTAASGVTRGEPPTIAAANINDALSQRIEGAGPVDRMTQEIAGTNAALRDQNEILREGQQAYKTEKMAIAGASFLIDVINADAQYRQAQGQAQFNIMMARNQANDALYRGRMRAGQAKSEARTASDNAILALAAQGQDVSGTGVQRVTSSIDAIGEQNAMLLEINGIKEALGFQLEEVAIDYQLENAGINRDMTILSSALNLGATAAGVL